MKFDEFLNENPEFKEKYERLTDEEKQQLTEAVKTIENIANRLFEFAKQAVKICKKTISLYPNKRVIHLAVRSKKARTRKKNMHRILKDIQRYSERGCGNE